jgi:hypothetical protein
MRRLLLSLTLVALVAAGCGGEDALTKSEYQAKARQICRKADKATNAVTRPTRTTNAAIADYFDRLLAVNRATTDDFADLKPPDALEKAHDDALKANREGVDEVARLVKELRSGGDARALLQAAQPKLEDLSRRSGDAAKRLGVPECADRE